MAPDPADRYSNAAKVYEELTAFLYTLGRRVGANDLAEWLRSTQDEPAAAVDFKKIRDAVVDPDEDVELLEVDDEPAAPRPPLRSHADIAALRAGVKDGTIDALATDHAPHPRRDKELSLDQAPPGMLGLETALGVALGVLDVDLVHLVRIMSIQPAQIAGIADRHGRDVEVGAPANMVVFDPNITWQVSPDSLASKSRNTPYVGMTLRGKVRHTFFNGAATVLDGEARR
jgi:dihydroorotase